MRLLIVDDDEDTRKLERDLLLQAGHRVTMAGSATEAIVHLKMAPYDLILLDIVMPGIDGHQFGQHLSSSSETFDIPVLVVSSRRDPESHGWARLNNCVGYLEKPFTLLELLDAVDDAARRSGRGGEEEAP